MILFNLFSTRPKYLSPYLPKYLPALVCIGMLGSASVARANDASLALSGSPRPMAGHPSVAMHSERIFLRVEKDRVRADCRFTFVNLGPACTVRMGFPDDSWEREAGDSGDGPFSSSFTSFRSYLDGRRVPTRLEAGENAGRRSTLWHVKGVRFGARGQANSVRRVREVYTVPIGAEMTFGSRLAGYTLSTGSSWAGPIGKSTVEVFFTRSGRGGLRAFELSSMTPRRDIFSDPGAVSRVAGLLRAPGTVVYQGPGRAQILDGHSLRWVRAKWRPSQKDDIVLHFKMP